MLFQSIVYKPSIYQIFMKQAHLNQTADNPPVELVADIKYRLDGSEQQLPSHIVSKLRQARQRALETARAKSTRRFRFPQLTPQPWLASCASLLSVALIVGYIQLHPTADEQLVAMDEESEILFADDNLELYEDLAFYRWLANTGY